VFGGSGLGRPPDQGVGSRDTACEEPPTAGGEAGPHREYALTLTLPPLAAIFLQREEERVEEKVREEGGEVEVGHASREQVRDSSML
jgi:hypothetical protein